MIAGLIILAFLAVLPGQASEVFVFHYGDKVSLTEECNPAKIFFNVCSRQGTVIGFSDEKNSCYPQVTYVVEFQIETRTVKLDYCGRQLILKKTKE